MKKYIYLIGIALLIQACGVFKTFDPQHIRIGMSRDQVIELAGLPVRILTVNETKEGVLEVLEYHTYNNDVYALEFWDDYLTGYQFLYENIQYVPCLHPPVAPPLGQPIIVSPGHPKHPKPRDIPNPRESPGRPGGGQKGPASEPRGGGTRTPTENVRPSERPGNTPSTRPAPDNNTSRPRNEGTRIPSESVRPGSNGTRQPAESVRPAEGSRGTGSETRNPQQSRSESGTPSQSGTKRR